MQKKKQVEFTLKDLLPIGLTFVVTGIVLAYGLDIVSDVGDDFTPATYEANATADTLKGVANLAEKIPTLATVAVAAIIIGVLISAFSFRT